MKKRTLIKLEIEGKTMEEAIEKATKQLGVSKDLLNIRVVSEEKKGLFGMEGAKPAKIIVSLKDKKQN